MECFIKKDRILFELEDRTVVFEVKGKYSAGMKECCDEKAEFIHYRLKGRSFSVFEIGICKKHKFLPKEIAKLNGLSPIGVFSSTFLSTFGGKCPICTKETSYRICNNCFKVLREAVEREFYGNNKKRNYP